MRHLKRILVLLVLVAFFLCGTKNAFAGMSDTKDTYTLEKCREESGDRDAGNFYYACSRCMVNITSSDFDIGVAAAWFNNTLAEPNAWGIRITTSTSPVYLYTKLNQCGSTDTSTSVNSIEFLNQEDRNVDYITKLSPSEILYTGTLDTTGKFVWSMAGNMLSTTFKVTDMFYEDVLEQQRLYQENPSAPNGYWWCIDSGYNGAWGLNVVIQGWNLYMDEPQWHGNIPIIYDPCDTNTTGQSWTKDATTPAMAYICCTDNDKDTICDNGADGGDGGDFIKSSTGNFGGFLSVLI